MSFLMIAVPAFVGGCRAKVPQIETAFVENFDKAELGPVWHDTGGGYALRDGALRIKKAYNHPLWLRQRLPANVAIELDVMSNSPSGDIKFEIYGDGESFDPDKQGYIATGYVLVFGGWSNSLSIIAKQNEHNEGVKASRPDVRVQPGKTYHYKVTRKDGVIDWQIDGQPFLRYADPEPLKGSGNEFFGFNNWESDVVFDNLSIRPLE